MHLHAFLVDVFQLVVWLILLVAIFVPLEQLCGAAPSRIWRKQMGVDLLWYFINSLLPTAIISIPVAFIIRTLNGLDPLGFYSAVAALPLWFKLPAALFVNDFGAYWAHRALHAHPVLWRFHAVHHSAEQMDWLVNTRAHPLDIVIVRLCGIAPVYLLGLATGSGPHLDQTVATLAIFGTLWTFFIHSNIRVRLGPLEWLISSPAFHHWHHTNDEHRDRNFAFVFPVIDRFFRTSWLPKHWPPSYGIDSEISPTITGQFFDPLDPLPAARNEKPERVETPQERENSPATVE